MSAPATAYLLAGGAGTRLRSVVSDRQKVVAEVGGRPMLLRWLDELDAQGVRRVVVCAGHRADTVERALAGWSGTAEVVISVEPEPRGTAGAVGLARRTWRHDGPAVVLNGDSWCELDLGALAAFHARRGGAATLTVTAVGDTARYGAVAIGAGGRVLGFQEKGRTGPGWINAGVYLLAPAVLDALPSDRPASLEREVLPAVDAWAWRGGDRFVDIGVPDDYARSAAVIDGASRLEGLVLLDRDGTIVRHVHHLVDPADLSLIPGAARAIRLLRDRGLKVAVVTNQSVVGRGLITTDGLAAVHARLRALLAAEGAAVDDLVFCPHRPDEGCGCRKPAPGLARQVAERLGVGLDGAFVVGDYLSDIGLARAIGATAVQVLTGHGETIADQAAADLVCEDLWCAAVAILRSLEINPAAADG